MSQARLLDVVRDQIRVKHYSYRTETSYLGWIRRFIRFHGGRHPRDMSGPEVEQFLSYLATERNVAASTQNQAWSTPGRVVEGRRAPCAGTARGHALARGTVRDGKGAKDRCTMLPDSTIEPLNWQLKRVRSLFEVDRRVRSPLD